MRACRSRNNTGAGASGPAPTLALTTRNVVITILGLSSLGLMVTPGIGGREGGAAWCPHPVLERLQRADPSGVQRARGPGLAFLLVSGSVGLGRRRSQWENKV